MIYFFIKLIYLFNNSQIIYQAYLTAFLAYYWIIEVSLWRICLTSKLCPVAAKRSFCKPRAKYSKE